MLNNVSSTGAVAEPIAAPVVSTTPAPKSTSVPPSPQPISATPAPQATTTNTPAAPVMATSSDQFQRVPGQQIVDLTGNLPGAAGALAGDPVTPAIDNNANSALLDFYPTNDSTVLFSSQNLLQQVLIADGADPQFVAALASLAAQNPNAVMGMLEAVGNGNYNVNFFVASQEGTNKQVTVQVSDNFLPANLPQDNQGNGVIWAALVNKAYAKMLDQGLVGDANPLQTLTGRQLTVLDGNSNSATLWAALSLANPPLHVPVTVMTAPADRHPESGLPADRNLSVLNTFRDENGEAMASLHKPGTLDLPGMKGGDANALFKVPLQVLEKAIVLTVIADGHPAFDLLNPTNPLDPANIANCCLHSRKSRGSAEHGNDILRVFDNPTRLNDHRCLSCPMARHMCMP